MILSQLGSHSSGTFRCQSHKVLRSLGPLSTRRPSGLPAGAPVAPARAGSVRFSGLGRLPTTSQPRPGCDLQPGGASPRAVPVCDRPCTSLVLGLRSSSHGCAVTCGSPWVVGRGSWVVAGLSWAPRQRRGSSESRPCPPRHRPALEGACCSDLRAPPRLWAPRLWAPFPLPLRAPRTGPCPQSQ